MISIALSRRIIGNSRGSTLAAALGLVFLIFAITTISLGRVASTYAQMAEQHDLASALFLADAGLQNAAHRLTIDRAYSGEKGTRLPTGKFDVKVEPAAGGYVVTSTGHAGTALRRHPRKTVRAVVFVTGRSFRISDWRENP